MITKDSVEWVEIRSNADKFFAAETMRYFGSKIYWNTLTRIGNQRLFVGRENNFDGSKQLFSVYGVSANFDFAVISMQKDSSLAEAKQRLNVFAEKSGYLALCPYCLKTTEFNLCCNEYKLMLVDSSTVDDLCVEYDFDAEQRWQLFYDFDNWEQAQGEAAELEAAKAGA